MEALISGPMACALAARRDALNARFEATRRRYPGLDARAFALLLRTHVAPAVEAVARVSPDRCPPVTLALYDLVLMLLGKHCIGPEGRWAHQSLLGAALSGAAPHLARDPQGVSRSLANALFHLSEVPDARAPWWVEQTGLLAPRCRDPATFLAAGRVLAWRAGLAGQRRSALAACRTLDPPVAGLTLGVDGADLGSVLDRMDRDPWLPPDQAAVVPGAARELRVAAVTGGFRGFGGPFIRPPRVQVSRGVFVAWDGETAWRVDADCFGATVTRIGASLPAADPVPDGVWVDAVGGASLRGRMGSFPQLAERASWASDGVTMVVVPPRSHRVHVLAAL